MFFPGDEVLLVCTDDPDVAPAFFAAAERIYRQAAVPISPQGYTIVGPSIVGLDSTGRSPLRAQAVRPFGALAEHEYAAQTRRLRQHFAEQAVDMSVAEVQVIETPRGSCTMTVWTQGTPPVPCLLPVADYVTLFPADRTDHVTTPFPVFAGRNGPDPGPEPAAAALSCRGLGCHRRSWSSCASMRWPCRNLRKRAPPPGLET